MAIQREPIPAGGELNARNARELLNLLSPSGRYFAEDPTSREWIFRGHADASWPLLPTVFRNYVDVPGGDPERPWSPIVRQEAEILREFVSLADRGGLVIPGHSARLVEELDWCVEQPGGMQAESAVYNWPSETVLPSLALARHYRLPTRLMDWSYNPLVAAYFACVDVAKRVAGGEPQEGQMCLWALSPVQRVKSQGVGRGERCASYEHCAVAMHGNLNMMAQQGLFLLSRHMQGAPLFEPLDVAVKRTEGVQIAKVTLPWSAARDLLRELALLHVDGASLFPGYEGAVRAMTERTWY